MLVRQRLAVRQATEKQAYETIIAYRLLFPLMSGNLKGFRGTTFLMKVRVLFHDHCFDGAAAAAFVTRFLEGKFYPGADFSYTGLAHRADQLFEDSLFDGDINAIVDFKYSTNPNVTWWFDHHQSAFLTPEDAEHFRRDTSGRKFLDPSFRSCTKFIATLVGKRFGFEAPDLEELVTWADIVDGALFESAQAAVDMAAPALKLTLVIEGSEGPQLVQKILRKMQREPLAQIIRDPEICAEYVRLREQHVRNIDVIRKEGSCDRGVIYFDLVDYGVEGYNKFIPYYLFPNSAYTVSVSTSSFRTKVSVGSNPWVREPLRHNLATICERYGGGGHPKVGAIS
ncbi:MAG: hypothetical protein ACRD34_07665, partial [Bryobacteraceae bacterium]